MNSSITVCEAAEFDHHKNVTHSSVTQDSSYCSFPL